MTLGTNLVSAIMATTTTKKDKPLFSGLPTYWNHEDQIYYTVSFAVVGGLAVLVSSSMLYRAGTMKSWWVVSLLVGIALIILLLLTYVDYETVVSGSAAIAEVSETETETATATEATAREARESRW